MRRRDLLAAGLAGPAWLRAPRRRPNILFLFTDDQRFDTIRALGNPEIRTPALDRLARRGTAFTQAHNMGGAAPAVCVASRAMLLSGQTMFRADAHVEAASRGRDAPCDLFPEHFRRHGYVTFGTGKWHHRAPRYARCFSAGSEIFLGGMSDHDQVPVHDFRPAGAYPQEPDRLGARFSSELFADAAIRFLAQQDGAAPFLAYVSFTAPHDPRHAPPDFAALYPPGRLSAPANFAPQHPFDNGELKIRDELLAPFPRTAAVVREHLAAYYAMITHLDTQIGRVLDALDRSRAARDTLVIFASDNGLALGQHGLFGKQSLYDHSVRVPLMFAGPDVPRGRRTDSLCYLLDLFPTLCEFAGLERTRTVEGVSLWPAMRNPGARVRDSLLRGYRNFQRAVTTGDWKLIRYYPPAEPRTQLFHLRRDPGERRDLAGDPAHAARVRHLSGLLAEWMKRAGDPLAAATSG